MIDKKAQIKKQKGFTLIELLLYAALLVIAGVVAVAVFIQVVNITETSRRSRESLDNAKGAMDTIVQEIRHADSVYTPTSTLDATIGQLSLETSRDVPTDEDSTYVDIYVDGERLYLKREGQADQLVTSEKVKIKELRFSLLDDAASRPAIQIKLTVEYFDQIRGPGNSVTLTSTSTLRAYD
jgi:type II secretory pathway pseudopilin PulG